MTNYNVRLYCSQELREEFLGVCSVDSPYFEFLWYLLRTSYKEKESDTLILPYELLRQFSTTRAEDNNTELFLKNVSKQFPAFSYSLDFDKLQGKARTGMFEWPTSLKDAYYRDLDDFDFSSKVHVKTGKYRTKYKAIQEQQERQEGLSSSTGVGSAVTLKIIRFMNSQSMSNYTKVFNRNSPKAIEMAKALDNKWERESALNSLAEMHYYPRPDMKAVGHSDRVYPITAGLLTLKGDIRKALTAGMVDVDMTNAHIALLAKITGSKELNKVLKENKSIWDLYPWPKKLIKKHCYSAAYGMNYYGLLAQSPQGFVDHWLTKLVIDVCSRRMKDISSALYLELVTNKAVEVKDRKLESLLSEEVQAYEALLLWELIRIVESHGETVFMTQHDGLTILFYREKSKAYKLSLIKCDFDQFCENLGVNTSLSYE